MTAGFHVHAHTFVHTYEHIPKLKKKKRKKKIKFASMCREKALFVPTNLLSTDRYQYSTFVRTGVPLKLLKPGNWCWELNSDPLAKQ